MSKLLIFSLVFIVSAFISSVSQVLLKKSALKTYEDKTKEYLNPYVIVAYAIFLIATFLTIYAYQYVPLSMGPILEASGYIFVAILGATVLKEKLTYRKVAGIFVIITGIIIFSL